MPPKYGRTLLCLLLFAFLTAAAAVNDGYIFVEGKTLTTVGDDIDFAMADKLLAKHGEHFLWIRRGGKTFVTSDKATLERAKELLKPQRELNARRADIAMRQVPLNRDIAKYAMEQALLGAELAKLSPERDDSKVAELQSKLKDVSAKLKERSAQQTDLNKELRSVTDAQQAMQPELMKSLGAFADETIAHGLAKAE